MVGVELATEMVGVEVGAKMVEFAVQMHQWVLFLGILQLDDAAGLPLIEPYEFQLLSNKPFYYAQFAYKDDKFYLNHLFSVLCHLF